MAAGSLPRGDLDDERSERRRGKIGGSESDPGENSVTAPQPAWRVSRADRRAKQGRASAPGRAEILGGQVVAPPGRALAAPFRSSGVGGGQSTSPRRRSGERVGAAVPAERPGPGSATVVTPMRLGGASCRILAGGLRAHPATRRSRPGCVVSWRGAGQHLEVGRRR
jgi:hypothetical protein